jgi:hypothetical protein
MIVAICGFVLELSWKLRRTSVIRSGGNGCYRVRILEDPFIHAVRSGAGELIPTRIQRVVSCFRFQPTVLSAVWSRSSMAEPSDCRKDAQKLQIDHSFLSRPMGKAKETRVRVSSIFWELGDSGCQDIIWNSTIHRLGFTSMY